MFVFKAAVVGAGVMGGEIAQVIAAADVPVVLKDVEQRFVDAGLAKAREVTENQAAKLVDKGKLTQEQGDAQVGRILAQHHRRDRVRRLRRRRLRDRGGAGADGDQARGLRRARRGHARPRGARLQHLGAVDHRDRRRDAAARQGRRLPLLLARVGDAPGRGDRGRRDLGGDDPGRGALRPADPQDADPRGRVPGLRRQPDPRLDRVGDLALPGRDRRCRSRRSTSSSRSARRCRWARSAWPTCRGSTRS